MDGLDESKDKSERSKSVKVGGLKILNSENGRTSGRTRRGKMILIKVKYRPKNDFYFCYIFHVSIIVSFHLRAEKRLLKHFASSRRLYNTNPKINYF